MNIELLSLFEFVLLGLNAAVSLHRFAWDLDPAHSSDANSQIQWYYVLTVPYAINWAVRPLHWYRLRKNPKSADVQNDIMYNRAQGIAISLLFILQAYSDVRNPVEGMFPQAEMSASLGLSVAVTALAMIPFIKDKKLQDVCVRPVAATT